MINHFLAISDIYPVIGRFAGKSASLKIVDGSLSTCSSSYGISNSGSTINDALIFSTCLDQLLLVRFCNHNISKNTSDEHQ